MKVNARPAATVLGSLAAQWYSLEGGRMLGWLRWRGKLPAAVFVTGVAGLITANESPALRMVTPWLISLGVLAALMWAFGQRKGQ